MLKKLRNQIENKRNSNSLFWKSKVLIESKRNSKSLFWKFLVFGKDSVWKIYENVWKIYKNLRYLCFLIMKLNKYFSQRDQDKWVIEEVFSHKKNGFFLDIGAGDGVIINNILNYIFKFNLYIPIKVFLFESERHIPFQYSHLPNNIHKT